MSEEQLAEIEEWYERTTDNWEGAEDVHRLLAEVRRLRGVLKTLYDRCDGGYESDAGGRNVTVYDFDGQKIIAAALGK